jgi:hypothetical protein
MYVNPYINEFDQSWDVYHDPFLIHTIPKCGTHFIQKVCQLMTPHNIVAYSATENMLRNVKNSDHLLRIFQPFSNSTFKLIRKYNYKVIAMVRDPRDALISHVFYMRTFAKSQNTRRDFFIVGPDFDKISLEQQIKSLIIGDSYANSYIDFYKERVGWALSPHNLAVKFEDLVSTVGGGDDQTRMNTILAIAQYINMNLSSSHLDYILANMGKDCTTEMHNGQVFQRSAIGNWKTFLNDEHKELLKQKIGKELILLGYETDFDW